MMQDNVASFGWEFPALIGIEGDEVSPAFFFYVREIPAIPIFFGFHRVSSTRELNPRAPLARFPTAEGGCGPVGFILLTIT